MRRLLQKTPAEVLAHLEKARAERQAALVAHLTNRPDDLADLRGLDAWSASKTALEHAVRVAEEAIERQRPAAEAFEAGSRKAALAREKANLEATGDKRAATWQARWESASGEIVSVLDEMRADDRACEVLSDKLREEGLVGLWPAIQRLRQRLGVDHRSLDHETMIPAFDPAAGLHWPPRRAPC